MILCIILKARRYCLLRILSFPIFTKLDSKDTVKDPQGVIPLEDCIVNTDHKIKSSRQNTFELIATKMPKTFYIQAKSEDEMREWIEAVISGKNFYNVSNPFELKHHIHVDFNSDTGFVVCHT